jgi:hypothetical protein
MRALHAEEVQRQRAERFRLLFFFFQVDELPGFLLLNLKRQSKASKEQASKREDQSIGWCFVWCEGEDDSTTVRKSDWTWAIGWERSK